MSLETENKTEEEIDTSNIFEEFNDDSDLKKEVKGMVDSQEKDAFYYLSMFGTFVQNTFWVLLLVLVLLYGYIFIQENENIKDSNILDPFCVIFLWDIKNTNTFCSSITSLNKEYEKQLEVSKESQVTDIISILEQLYKLEHFIKTKEITFLSDRTESKLQALKILEEFDTLKNAFEPIEKDKILCYDIEINSENIFKARCEAFSAWYEDEINGFDCTDDFFIKWTSISIANSFLNFIEKNSDELKVLDRQKIFSSQNIIWDSTWFTNKTTFYLKLKYSANNLSL